MPPKKRERCIKEVHLLQQLSHPNIITMFDAFVDGDQLVIITEWAPGGACTLGLWTAAAAFCTNLCQQRVCQGA